MAEGARLESVYTFYPYRGFESRSLRTIIFWLGNVYLSIMNRVVYFEIQADDLERAARFYREVFGWNIQPSAGSADEYWVIMSAEEGSSKPDINGGLLKRVGLAIAAGLGSKPGINGGLLKRPAKTPPTECGTNSYVCTITVEDFDATAQKIAKAGGHVALPKFAIPGMAWQGYFLDTEHNTFGIHQSDKNAK